MRIGKVVIPCRLESERLPKKMMIDVFGKPMIEHVWRRACLAVEMQDVVVVTDSELIASHMTSLGAEVYVSQLRHDNGTSRVSEYMAKTSFDFALILQGDEILIKPKLVKDLFLKMSRESVDMINAVSPLDNVEDLSKTDIVKCWINRENSIGFIFRNNPLRDSARSYQYLRVINGLFAVSRNALVVKEKITHGIANSESIEQLGMLDQGIQIFAHEVDTYAPSVNTQEELDAAIALLSDNEDQRMILKSILEQN